MRRLVGVTTMTVSQQGYGLKWAVGSDRCAETGAHATLRGQTATHLVQRDVDRLFDQAKIASLVRIEL